MLTSAKVLSLDSGNAPAQAELAQLDTSAAKPVSAASPSPVPAAAIPASRAAVLPSVTSRPSSLSSSAAPLQKEPPSKPTAFKAGFLNPQPTAAKPRRIQIKEDSDESDGEAVAAQAPAVSALLAPASATASDATSPVKPSKAAAAAAAAAASAVTDEDIVARAARIASMNVIQSFSPQHPSYSSTEIFDARATPLSPCPAIGTSSRKLGKLCGGLLSDSILTFQSCPCKIGLLYLAA